MKIARVAVALALCLSAPAFAAKHTRKPAPTPEPPPLLQPDLSGHDPNWLHDPKSDCWAHFDGTIGAGLTFTWTGRCKDHVLDGQGILVWVSGGRTILTAEGMFLLGRSNGPGKIVWPDGNAYEGELRDGMAEGQGTSSFKGSDDYVGAFHGNRAEGPGVLTRSNGDTITGTFHGKVPVGPAVFKSASGLTFKGEIVLPHNDPALPVPAVHYPEISMRLNEDGAAIVFCIVGKDGAQRDIRIAVSSGFARLDQAAIDYVTSLHAMAGTVDGVPVEMGYDRQVIFRIGQ